MNPADIDLSYCLTTVFKELAHGWRFLGVEGRPSKPEVCR
jgi:hypothetical protein